MTARYTGHLRRDATGAITGELRDFMGWVIALTATPSPEGGFTLDGVLGETPDLMRVPFADDVVKV